MDEVQLTSVSSPLSEAHKFRDSGTQRMPETKHKRDVWANQADYVISVIGSIIGYGNLWRFPYLCNRNGGGAFLIPFLLFLVTCALPLFFLETAVGQFAGSSNVRIWGVCPLFKGVGVGQFVCSCITMTYYQIIITWSLYYMGMSCYSILPWTSCNNSWNTPDCLQDNWLEKAITVSPNITVDTPLKNSSTNFSFEDTDVEQFWQYNVLGVSGGFYEMGHIQWHLALSLVASCVLVFACLVKGVRSVGKVVYVTALLPYVLLTVLLIRTLLLPGALDGLIFYLTPDFGKLADTQVWLEALVQVFYSSGPGWGMMVVLASYNRFHDNVLRNSIICTFAGEGTSLFSGFVIFTVLGFMANKAQVGVSEVATSGPGLGFVAYPEGLTQLPLPQLWSFLFFVMMVTVGLDSQFAYMETIITVVIDEFPHALRKRRTLVTAVTCILCCLFGLVFITKGGIYYFQLVDWYLAAVCLITFGISECIVFVWIYGSTNLSDDVELMIGRRIPALFTFFLGYVTPILLSVALVLLMWQFEPPTFGTYVYPVGARVIGWILAAIPVLPIPIFAVKTLLQLEGSFKERLKQSLRPDESWKPSPREYRHLYCDGRKTESCACLNPCRP